MKNVAIGLVLGLFSVLAGYAWADTPVTANQGKPGTQGPWPVTCVSGCSGGSGGGGGSGSLTTDGGFLGTVLPAACRRYPQANTTVGTSTTIVPASGLAGRVYVDVCNSALNASTAQCICAAESVPASVAVGTIGDVLFTGDCARYPTNFDGGNPRCVCNQAGVALLSAECAP